MKLADGKATFRYRATDSGKLKTRTLPTEEFIRRFLQRVLPRGFVKVRYYGFLVLWAAYAATLDHSSRRRHASGTLSSLIKRRLLRVALW